ncbi:MAG: glycosyltransferase family 2 protein [Candidatus Berkiellales bacterium]
MMHKPLTLSIVTVCYNSARTIEETLSSVLSQDYPHVQYIVVDGASTDGTLEVLKRYEDRIHTIISEPDEGIYHAMNKGISRATGDVVGLLNADDLYAHPRVISAIAEAFHNSEIDACYGDLVYFKENDPNKIHRYWRSNAFIPGSFAKGWSPAHPTFFVRKAIYDRYGFFDTRYSMGNDIELMMRFLEKHRINSLYLGIVLVKMRLGGVSNQSIKNIIEQNKNVVQAARDLGIPISVLQFIGCKLLNRISQFILRPRSESDEVK